MKDRHDDRTKLTSVSWDRFLDADGDEHVSISGSTVTQVHHDRDYVYVDIPIKVLEAILKNEKGDAEVRQWHDWHRPLEKIKKWFSCG